MRGFNGYKQVVGRKRHILVDTENSLLSAVSDLLLLWRGQAHPNRRQEPAGCGYARSPEQDQVGALSWGLTPQTP